MKLAAQRFVLRRHGRGAGRAAVRLLHIVAADLAAVDHGPHVRGDGRRCRRRCGRGGSAGARKHGQRADEQQGGTSAVVIEHPYIVRGGTLPVAGPRPPVRTVTGWLLNCRICRRRRLHAAREPQDILALALKEYSPDLAISFSGAEDVVLVDMAAKAGGRSGSSRSTPGRLHPRRTSSSRRVREHYGIPIEAFFPQPEAVAEAGAREGPLLVLQGRPQGVLRHPQGRAAGARARRRSRAWVTGQRKDQSPGTRAEVPVVQLDPTFGTPERPLVKFNPLANWTSKQVWAYIREHDVPYNALHDRGFFSIGCEPCTRPTNPGQHEREGRWWWEEETKKECGLHAGNVAGCSGWHSALRRQIPPMSSASIVLGLLRRGDRLAEALVDSCRTLVDLLAAHRRARRRTARARRRAAAPSSMPGLDGSSSLRPDDLVDALPEAARPQVLRHLRRISGSPCRRPSSS